MRIKAVGAITIICLLVSVWFCQAADNVKADVTEPDSGLHVYLPREVTIDNDAPKLAQVVILRGQEALVAAAESIAVGRISVPGQEIIVDRPMLLGRLACNGIPSSTVTLTGAEKVTVKRQHRIIGGSEFVELAGSLLEKNLPNGSIYQYKPIRVPKDLVVAGAFKDVKLTPRLVKSAEINRVRVRITASSGHKEIGVREVTFRLKYNCHKLVTQLDIEQGQVISPENTRIEKVIADYPEPANWAVPYGLVAKRRLPANTIIRPNMVGPAKSQLVVKRNQNVVIRIDTPALLITANGKALQNGTAGEYIKVKMQISNESQRVIIAKVNEDGTLEPVL